MKNFKFSYQSIIITAFIVTFGFTLGFYIPQEKTTPLHAQDEENKATIIAHKIVCADEADLPNWGKGGPDIVTTTAQNYIDTHPNCQLTSNWYFQFGFENTSNPGDNTGVAPSSSGWTTFGPTNANGRATISIHNPEGNNTIKIREVFQEGYVPFTYNAEGGQNANNISAELYCSTDVLNYDNYDYITNSANGISYQCIAFNVSEETQPICGNNIPEEGEECDDGNMVNGDGCSSNCKEEDQQCEIGEFTINTDVLCWATNAASWAIDNQLFSILDAEDLRDAVKHYRFYQLIMSEMQ